MIKFDIEKALCVMHAEGESSIVAAEAVLASLKLAELFAKATNMSVDSALLSIMQQCSLARKKVEDKKNECGAEND